MLIYFCCSLRSSHTWLGEADEDFPTEQGSGGHMTQGASAEMKACRCLTGTQIL